MIRVIPGVSSVIPLQQRDSFRINKEGVKTPHLIPPPKTTYQKRLDQYLLMQVGYKDLLKSNRSHQIKAQIKELSVIEQKAQQRADHAQELRIAEQQRADHEKELRIAEQQRADHEKELRIAEQQRADHETQRRIAEQQRVTQLQKEYDLLVAYAATLGITPLKSTDPIDASRRQDPLISVSTAPTQIVDTV
jgi:hypothetical protein